MLTGGLMMLNHSWTFGKYSRLESRDKDANAAVGQQLNARAVWLEILLRSQLFLSELRLRVAHVILNSMHGQLFWRFDPVKRLGSFDVCRFKILPVYLQLVGRIRTEIN